jgi:hypothetical protein
VVHGRQGDPTAQAQVFVISPVGGGTELTYTGWTWMHMRASPIARPLGSKALLALSVGLCCSLRSVSGVAQDSGPSKASCAEAYETAQERRASGQLQETRERLAYCAQEECPSFVQKDCARWLTEVDRELPSVRLVAVGVDPKEAKELNVTIDGKIVSAALSGSPVTLDPGRHELVIERPGQEPLRRVVMAQQGVQNRTLRIDFGQAAKAPAEASATTDSAATMEPLAYAALGLGAIGIGVFAVAGTLGSYDEESFRQDCPAETTVLEMVTEGVCHSSTVQERRSTYQNEFVMADVGLITGIAGLTAGTVLLVLSKLGSSTESSEPAPEDSARLNFQLSPTEGGAWGSVQGQF